MNPIRGVLRLALVFVILVAGCMLVLIAGLVPLRVRRIRLGAWVVRGMVHLVCRVFNIQVACPNPSRLYKHEGLVFSNHFSHLDSLILTCVLPVRFLSNMKVASYPVVGWIAKSIGTVFVTREDPASRRQARTAVADALRREPYPPLVIFPEGRLGPGDELLPFRHGAFEIAAAQHISFMPCALRYDETNIDVWHKNGENLVPAFWRVAQFPGPVQVDVVPLAPVNLGADEDAVRLALATQTAIGAVLWPNRRPNAG